jgi:hypothetical protein
MRSSRSNFAAAALSVVVVICSMPSQCTRTNA